ncbi:hypothetical protein JOD43_000876 [Pullulanibacillus pueri]|nr:hypothetical protein [Pullulanibacillus pueri]
MCKPTREEKEQARIRRFILKNSKPRKWWTVKSEVSKNLVLKCPYRKDKTALFYGRILTESMIDTIIKLIIPAMTDTKDMNPIPSPVQRPIIKLTTANHT